MRKGFLFILFLLSYSAVWGQGNYVYTDNCRKAYSSFMALQNLEGHKAIERELVKNPNNLMAVYIADYEDCFILLFNGDGQEYELRKANLEKRIAQLNKGDENSPWYRMCKASVYMHWAIVSIRFNDRIKAANYFRKSFLLLKENNQIFPDFEYDDVFFGIEEAAVGVLPDNYKWIASIFGLKGNLKAGANKINHFVAQHEQKDPFYAEAVIYSVYLNYFLLSDKEEAWRIVSSKDYSTDNNLMNAFVKANVALNYRKASVAKTVLEEAKQNKYYKDYPILEYEYGYSLLNGLDERSIDVFKGFLNSYTGKQFEKDALQKLAYAHYIFGMPETAMQYKSMIANKGNANVDADKQAQRFAENITWPNKLLLKCQLLIDGGYYQKAYKMLEAVAPKDFPKTAELLEYHFRWARVNDELGYHDIAVKHYNKAIEIGSDRREQFAARAALQLGFLYEELKLYAKAIYMYDVALSMKQHDFKNGIDQQAKAGISRLRSN